MQPIDIGTQSQVSKIVTRATALGALQPDADAEVKARFLGQYQMAIFRYLRACSRSEEAALELLQDFCVKYLRGDLTKSEVDGAGFDPRTGRFSSYLKRVLHNLVRDWLTKDGREHAARFSLDECADGADKEVDAFIDIFKQAILNRAWDMLKLAEEKSEGTQPYYRVLLAVSAQGDIRSKQLAEQLGTTEATARKTKQRARSAYANALIDSVKEFAGTESLAEIESELADLELLQYCDGALRKRMTDSQSR